MSTKLSLVGTDSYPVLNPDIGNHYFGGEAVQQVLLAKAFRDAGFEVSMVCMDYGQPDGEVIDGIRVFKTFKPHSGLPVVRFFHPRLTGFNSALKRADADIYFQSCAGANTGFVARYCKKYKKKFVFRLASDSDCIPGEQLINYARDRKLYEYGLKRADVISSQSAQQTELLKHHYGLPSTVINMACDLPSIERRRDKPYDFLWVSNIRECKRPDLLLDLARRHPKFKFLAIGGEIDGEEALYRKFSQEAAAADNVEFLGPIPYHQMSAYFQSTKAFLNTSDIEGFPNTFLQAWAVETPILSFFDPDGVIARLQAGIIARSFDDMVIQSEAMISDEPGMVRMGLAGYQYVIENYAGNRIVEAYRNALDI